MSGAHESPPSPVTDCPPASSSRRKKLVGRKKVMVGDDNSHPISSMGSINVASDVSIVDVNDELLGASGTRTNEPSHVVVTNPPHQDSERLGMKRKRTNEARKEYNVDHTRSLIWPHFNKIFGNDRKIEKASCKYCNAVRKADTKSVGTMPLWNHFNACIKARESNATIGQERLSDLAQGPGEKGGTLTWTFNQARAERALCKYILIDELPLCMVEKPGIHILIEEIQPLFVLRSRRKLTICCYDMYLEEKRILISYIRGYSQRVSLTTDTWTSQQRKTFMALTVHFIDDNWMLHKRILNFVPVSSHRGGDLGIAVELCLNDWGINKVFTVTVDNASANSGLVSYLKGKFSDRPNSSILQGKYMHMRCVAHIINLVVNDGLGEQEEKTAIKRIRAVVSYVRNSPTRYKKLCDRAKLERLASKRMLCYDVKTRWNSTYLMLRAAVEHRKAFEAFVEDDRYYKKDLGSDVPTSSDWQRTKFLIKYLKPFYKLTLRVSGSKYVTSNLVFHELFRVDQLLKVWLSGTDEELKVMAIKMKEKYDKYWGPVDNMNMLLYYVVILDPRRKLECIEWRFERMYTNVRISQIGDDDRIPASPGSDTSLLEKVKKGFREMFVEYKKLYGETTHVVPSPSVGGTSQGPIDDDDLDSSDEDEYVKARKRAKGKKQVKTELDRYLSEECEEDENLDVLQWWKREAHRFPVLSRMARDILAVPVTTVASEATFSTSGRILDGFRSSLTPRMAQAIICAQDWMRPNGTTITVEEDMDQLEELEKDFIDDETTILADCESYLG